MSEPAQEVFVCEAVETTALREAERSKPVSEPAKPLRQYRCTNCGQWFDLAGTVDLPLYCSGCEDYEEWKREEERSQPVNDRVCGKCGKTSQLGKTAGCWRWNRCPVCGEMEDRIEFLNPDELGGQPVNDANELLEALVYERGAIVTSADCSEMEIAFARQEGRFYVDPNGFGFVLRMGRWRAKAEAALKADYAEGGTT